MSQDTDLYQRMSAIAQQGGSGESGGWGSPDLFKSFRAFKDSPTWVRIVPGKYENPVDKGIDPCFTMSEHRVWKNNKLYSLACTALPGAEKGTGQNCVACYHMQRGDTAISQADRRVFTVLVLKHYHLVEKTSDRDSSKKYTQMRMCKGRGCELCDQNIPKQFGDRRWWSLGKNHFDDLIGANKSLRRHCTCGDDKIELVGFECGNCGEELLLVEGSRMTDDKIEVYGQSLQTCRKCSQQALPKEIIECGKCQDPKRSGLFNVNISVLTRGEKMGSHVVVEEWEVEGIPDEFKEDKEPWDFAKLFEPLSPHAAAKRLGVANPFAAGSDTGASGDGLNSSQQSEPVSQERRTRRSLNYD